ncbi:sodium-independent sulfate anion transporter-like isoform X2 [Ptychodera flava]|uniref:sodium-independent sulfate anion transporter-like isoform X2 n=1 Tax=Ptychodera flava TaxID=63121 RepID=UPI003969D1F3
MAQAIRDGASAVKTKVKDFAKESCTVENWKQKFPITLWLPKYRPNKFICDMIAGLTVGLTVLPQGLAYASIAHLPVQYGLYSAFMGCFVYCIFGTAKDVSIGPTAVMSLMMADFGGHSGREDGLNNPVYAITLCFFCGVVQFLMGLFHLGFLVNFISFPVINGFTSAAAVIIGVGQLRHIFGVPKYKGHGFLDDVYYTCKGLPQSSWQDIVMGVSCFIILMGMKKIKDKFAAKKAPETTGQKILHKTVWLLGTARNAVIVVLAACVAYAIVKHSNSGLRLVGHVPAGLPSFELPLPPYERELPPDGSSGPVEHLNGNVTVMPQLDHGNWNASINASDEVLSGNSTELPDVESGGFVKHYLPTGEVLSELGVGLAIIPLIGFLESIAIAKGFAKKNKYRVWPDQELIALGTANIMSSFVSAYPVTGSFSRTAVNSQSGVITPMGGVFTGLLVIISLAVLTPLFFFIPKSALAAVIICAVIAMFDYGTVKKLWRVKKLDLLPWFGTFLGSLWQGVEIGIIIGIGIDLCMLLYAQAKPDIEISQKEVSVIQVGYGIHYPAVEHIVETVQEECLRGETPQPCVVDCAKISHLDYSSIQALVDLCTEFNRNNVKFVLSGAGQNLLDAIENANIPHFQHCDTVDEGIKVVKDPDATHMLLTPMKDEPNHNFKEDLEASVDNGRAKSVDDAKV